MTGRQVADAISALGTLKSTLTPKKLAPILAHLGIEAVVRHSQNVYVGLSAIENGQGEIDFANSPRLPRSPPNSPKRPRMAISWRHQTAWAGFPKRRKGDIEPKGGHRGTSFWQCPLRKSLTCKGLRSRGSWGSLIHHFSKRKEEGRR